MKIVCDSCSAKYSIADEKVAGRVFKIRCKKCGAAIVVRGEAGAGGSQEAAAPGGGGFDYGGEAVWHVVVDGEQQGPFSPQQLGGMISANTIAWDTYVWREGFDDWKPAQDIEDLVQAIMNPGGGGAAAAEDPFSDQPTTMAASASPAAKSTPPAAAKAAKRDAGADLFAQSEASPFGGGGGDDDDVVASAPSPRVSGNQAMTGQRNENSVLFSLSNLQALATGAPGGGGGGGGPAPSAKPAAAAPKAGMAQGEGSGLIDIRALASATGLTGGGGGPAPSIGGGSPPKVDDLLSIGAPNVGLGSALAAPVIIAEKPEPKSGGGNGMIIAAAILGVCVLGGAGVFAYVSMNQPDPAATAPAVAAIAPGTAAAPPPSAAAVPAPPPSAAVPTPPPSAAVAAPPPSEAPATGGGTSTGSRSGSGRRGSTGSTGSTGGAAPSAPAADPAPAPSGGRTGSSSGSSGGDRSIDALLEGALGGGGGGRRGSTGAAPAAPAADASLPASPDRSAVMSAMSGVQGAVTACGTGEHGVASVQISVTGSTGRVANATVGGQFAGTPVGSCIARAVRGATFPHFRNPTFSFTYPFRI